MINFDTILEDHQITTNTQYGHPQAGCTCGASLPWTDRENHHKHHVLKVVAAKAWDEGLDDGQRAVILKTYTPDNPYETP